VIGLLECRHDNEDHVLVLVIVILDAGKVEIGGESSLSPAKHFPETRTPLEGQPIQNAALRQQLQQEGQNHFFLRDHDVAQSGFIRIALHLWLGQHC
jgi:hypothetical protein